MNEYKVIGENIKKRRKQLDLSQAQLAEMCNVACSYIGIIERGRKRCSVGTLLKITNQLKVSANYIFKGLIVVDDEKFNDDMTKYFADVPEEKRASLQKIVETVAKEYTK
jgi:transcriptional regulator with XRE-family HTH domain